MLSPHIIMWYNVTKCIIESKLNPTMCKVWIVKWNIYILKWKSKRKILALSSTFWSAHRVQLLWDISTSSTATLCQGQSCHISYFVPVKVRKIFLNLFPMHDVRVAAAPLQLASQDVCRTHFGGTYNVCPCRVFLGVQLRFTTLLWTYKIGLIFLYSSLIF